MAEFKSSDETFEECFRNEESIIEVHEAPKTYKVNLEKLLGWTKESEALLTGCTKNGCENFWTPISTNRRIAEAMPAPV